MWRKQFQLTSASQQFTKAKEVVGRGNMKSEDVDVNAQATSDMNAFTHAGALPKISVEFKAASQLLT